MKTTVKITQTGLEKSLPGYAAKALVRLGRASYVTRDMSAAGLEPSTALVDEVAAREGQADEDRQVAEGQAQDNPVAQDQAQAQDAQAAADQAQAELAAELAAHDAAPDKPVKGRASAAAAKTTTKSKSRK